MIFVETTIFTKQLAELLSDEEYAVLQATIAANPEAGDLIPGAGGLRKIRVAAKGRGKRGGARVIYYSFTAESKIAMLMVYPKNQRADLTAKERDALRSIIERWS